MKPFPPSRLLIVVVATLALLVTPLGAQADEPVEPEPTEITNLVLPSISGDARFGSRLVADPGDWSPIDVAVTYQWLRDGVPVSGATRKRYRLGLDDLGARMTVEVTAAYADLPEVVAVSTATDRVRRAEFERESRPTITGVPRFGRVLTAKAAELSPRPTRSRFQWLRDGKPIKGATQARYRVDVADVGAVLRLRQTVRRDGYQSIAPTSAKTRGQHRVPLRRTVTYSVQTKGAISANLATFKKQAQQTFDDPRGWRSAGIAFRRVPSGGQFRLILSQASLVPSFSSGCSSMWSCRVGDNVIINQDRWRNASPMWNAIGRSLRDYRHMVVNHETGHWLGHGHRECGGPGKLAPVMMQQSKGLAGCKANPWPTPSERFAPRF